MKPLTENVVYRRGVVASRSGSRLPPGTSVLGGVLQLQWGCAQLLRPRQPSSGHPMDGRGGQGNLSHSQAKVSKLQFSILTIVETLSVQCSKDLSFSLRNSVILLNFAIEVFCTAHCRYDSSTTKSLGYNNSAHHNKYTFSIGHLFGNM